MKRFALLGCLLSVGLLGCNNDPMIIVMIDGGGGGTDTGGGGTDSGTPGTDSGTPGTDAGGGCAPMSAPLPPAPVCARATLTCLMTATTMAMQQACLAADPMPAECNACLQQEIVSRCTTAPAMCADEYGNLQCCLAEECPTGDATCLNGALGGACMAQATALQNCANAEQTAMRCGVSATTCFMP
jgi:hypothetical protein